jgi:glutamate racemase
MIVIACNTASSLAYHDLVASIGDKIPVLNVIDPVVDFVAAQKQLKCVGVIGTKATIYSDLYAKKLLLARPGIEVKSLATPLLAPMIEEGFFSNTISKTVIHSYLSSPKLKNIDSLKRRIIGLSSYFRSAQEGLLPKFNKTPEVD